MTVISCQELNELTQSSNGLSSNVKVFDLSRPAVHAQLHIAGANFVAQRNLVSGELPATGRLPNLAALQAWANALNISPTDFVVAYDDEGGAWAGRFLWNLAMLGHQNYALLDGGIHAWLQSGFATQSIDDKTHIDVNNLSIDPPYPINWQAHLQAHATDILQAINFSPSTQSIELWDCRSASEYNGAQLMARRGGHIPTAINLEWTSLFDRNNGFKLLPTPVLREKLLAAGFSLNKPMVVYCQTHHRSGLAFVVAKLLGLKVAAYDGAWSEWGNDLNLPINLPIE